MNSKPTAKATLHPGDRVTLGTACQFLFQTPVPVSTTARLDLISGHRLPLSIDGILLMAETVVIGPGPAAHVPVEDLEKSIVLFEIRMGWEFAAQAILRSTETPPRIARYYRRMPR